MKVETKNVLIILAVVIFIVLAYILSGIYMKPEPKLSDTEFRPPANRLEKIREGFLNK